MEYVSKFDIGKVVWFAGEAVVRCPLCKSEHPIRGKYIVKKGVVSRIFLDAPLRGFSYGVEDPFDERSWYIKLSEEELFLNEAEAVSEVNRRNNADHGRWDTFFADIKNRGRENNH